jgi:hypothetical protein
MRFKKIVLYTSISAVILGIIVSLSTYLSLPDVIYLKHNNPKITAIMQLRKEQAGAQGRHMISDRIGSAFKPFPIY